MAQRIHKVIVTNQKALKAKYGAGLKTIQSAIRRLITADKKRGLKTLLVRLDSSTAMKRYQGTAVTLASDPKQNKAAIDKVFTSLLPDYLLILGAIDVVPHQDLVNPMHEPGGGDPDQFAYSDLPYACESPYSTRIQDFLGPTRVAGRLPDLTGGTDAKYLIGLLDAAAGYQSRPRSDYTTYLGMTAKVWSGSTAMSLSKVFGSSGDMQTSPAKGPHWTPQQFAARTHFVNCHGAEADPHYYGQQGNSYPISHDASLAAGKLSEGTIAAVECCYGAELYDPAVASQMSMCNTYLASNAYAFFGSSTIAYGPADGNGAADLITQYFLKHVLAGASTGRAALQARQDFVLSASVLDPVDLKTLAQFSLMGDPSVHPVESPVAAHAIAMTTSARGIPEEALTQMTGRASRRDALLKNGLALGAVCNYAVAAIKKKSLSKKVRDVMQSAAAEISLKHFNEFTVQRPAAVLPKGMKAVKARAQPAAETIHVAVGALEAERAPARQWVTILAREQDGAVMVRKLFSR